MKIKLKTHVTVAGRELKPGQIVDDLSPSTVTSFLAHGFAERVEEKPEPAREESAPAVETADAPPPVETAVATPAPRKKR